MLIQRADESRLLISDGQSLVVYVVQDDATLRQVWRVAPQGGVGIATQVSVFDPTHVWLFGEATVKRLRLADGEADLVVPAKAVDLRDVGKVVVAWDGRWSRGAGLGKACGR